MTRWESITVEATGWPGWPEGREEFPAALGRYIEAGGLTYRATADLLGSRDADLAGLDGNTLCRYVTGRRGPPHPCVQRRIISILQTASLSTILRSIPLQ